MDQAPADTPTFKNIKNMMETQEFVGKVVAYQANIKECADGQQWQRKEAPGVYYGYIKSWGVAIRGAGVGAPSFIPVNEWGSITHTQTLTDEFFQGTGIDGEPAFLKMREATSAETADIKSAIETSKAELDLDPREVHAALSGANQETPQLPSWAKRAARQLLKKFGR